MNTNDKITYKIDWVTMTFDFFQYNDQYGNIDKYIEGLNKLNKLYELLTYPNSDDRTEETRKFKDYTKRIYLGEFISLFINGCKNSKGLNHNKLEMSGHACSDFINRGGDWFKLFDFCTAYNGMANKTNFTRIDLAIDVRTKKYFDFDKLKEYIVNKKCYTSPAIKGRLEYSWNKLPDGSNDDGNTIYIGSISSSIQLCIYDKNLERQSAGDETPMLDECWYRFEIRFRDQKANWFVTEFLKSKDREDYSFIVSALYKVLDIKTLESDNKLIRQRDTAKWWLDFIGDITKISKFEEYSEIPITMATKEKYLKVNSGRAIMQKFLCDLVDFDNFNITLNNPFEVFMYQLILEKLEEFNNQDKDIINKARQKKGLDLIDINDVLFVKEKLEDIILG